MAQAAAPGRASGSLMLSLGFMSIPVKVYSGLSDSAIKRSRFVRDGDQVHKVGLKHYDTETGEEVAYGDVINMVEASSGALVELTDDEVAAAVGSPHGEAQVIAVVSNDIARNEYVPEDFYQLRPESPKKGKQPLGSHKAFRLLLDALEAEDAAAIVSFTLRGKPRYGALFANGDLITFAYADEVRERLPLPDPSHSEAELSMARQLLSQMRVGYIEVVDEAAAKVRDYVDTKAAGEEPVMVKEPTPATDDIMAALEASLQGKVKA